MMLTGRKGYSLDNVFHVTKPYLNLLFEYDIVTFFFQDRGEGSDGGGGLLSMSFLVFLLLLLLSSLEVSTWVVD